MLPSWEINHVPIDEPPWSVANREGNDQFKCPRCRDAVARRIPWADLAADMLPRQRRSTVWQWVKTANFRYHSNSADDGRAVH